jgi:hypothetical protein
VISFAVHHCFDLRQSDRKTLEAAVILIAKDQYFQNRVSTDKAVAAEPSFIKTTQIAERLGEEFGLKNISYRK